MELRLSLLQIIDEDQVMEYTYSSNIPPTVPLYVLMAQEKAVAPAALSVIKLELLRVWLTPTSILTRGKMADLPSNYSIALQKSQMQDQIRR
ncbi:hypothetical protein [Parasitella parasitica]|uniref:Uncharacterized protein n=1 Tax=Parasitella parasitica TaxID=35722 RepID=A0A0B7NHV8_9FUNG|nr:hypothetical protein [Parasitella parasitica]